jgi:hypothetical protein
MFISLSPHIQVHHQLTTLLIHNVIRQTPHLASHPQILAWTLLTPSTSPTTLLNTAATPAATLQWMDYVRDTRILPGAIEWYNLFKTLHRIPTRRVDLMPSYISFLSSHRTISRHKQFSWEQTTNRNPRGTRQMAHICSRTPYCSSRPLGLVCSLRSTCTHS